MKKSLYFLIFSITVSTFSQTPELFYEDGGDLGPIEIRNGYVYYIDQNIGLKQLSLFDPNEALLIATAPGGVAYIFWNPDESSVYFGNIFHWYKAPFDTTEITNATLFMDFSFDVYDLKEYNEEYYFPITDIGSFLNSTTNIDPFEGGETFGFINPIVTNIAIEDDIIYYSHGSTLHRATLSTFSETMEFLIDFDEPIDQLEVQGDYLYALLKESNSVAIFDRNQPAPLAPVNFITLDPTIYTIENLVIDHTDLYFTDSNQGSIFVIADAALSLEEHASFAPSIFPNPVADDLFFQGENISELRILDTNGKIITSNKDGMSEGEYIIDVSYLSKGVYFAHFISKDDKTIIKRFIKK
ncbi:T9SS type A sorting domain-containing protein [Dokdonia sp.]|uniref:T9SS type A sorting domain-containing protein n=1 Tax=Dokdonia sp. TaxID=2024995 RepID=UPI003266DD92